VVKLTDNSKEKEESRKKLIEKAAIPVIIRHRNWEEFKSNAENASAISFLLREEEGVFQADALKEGTIYTYSGTIPKINVLLKLWLSKELKVDEEKIFEGVLSIG